MESPLSTRALARCSKLAARDPDPPGTPPATEPFARATTAGLGLPALWPSEAESMLPPPPSSSLSSKGSAFALGSGPPPPPSAAVTSLTDIVLLVGPTTATEAGFGAEDFAAEPRADEATAAPAPTPAPAPPPPEALVTTAAAAA